MYGDDSYKPTWAINLLTFPQSPNVSLQLTQEEEKQPKLTGEFPWYATVNWSGT